MNKYTVYFTDGHICTNVDNREPKELLSRVVEARNDEEAMLLVDRSGITNFVIRGVYKDDAKPRCWWNEYHGWIEP